MNVCDLVVEEGGKGVAQDLRWWDVIGAGAGVGEFLHNVEELLAVVCIIVNAIFEGGFLGRSNEVMVFADGVLEGSMVIQCLFMEPFSLQFLAGLLGGSEVRGEPAGSLAGASVGGFIERGESIGAVVDSAPEVAGCQVEVGGWFSGEASVQLVSADFAPVVAGDLLGAVVRSGFPEGEVDAAVVGPWEFMVWLKVTWGLAEKTGSSVWPAVCVGVVMSCLSPRVARLSIRMVELESLLVKVQVAEEDVVGRG
ncbi:hypothetical protein NDU88_005024 [Pleurodeles waltl]|uniref:Uncharacterized protein n=1 Tax=Pleurodeles waltl TaxID=8319 RepID=A0AAV7M812_PLEWA|nr:hypothetical protein NDU88_005024 [Pleurodeles waltl]